MDVGVAEARGHRPSAQLDDPAGRPDMRLDRRVAADRDDPAVADGQGARPAPGWVHGGQPAAEEDEVGGTAWLIGPSAGRVATRQGASGHVGPDPAPWDPIPASGCAA